MTEQDHFPVHLGLRLTKEQKTRIQKIAEQNYRSSTGQIRYMIDHWEELVKLANKSRNRVINTNGL
tara:strand:+ start:184 stop:381 length:198 start_codon:yes stop_codon:yes gene_type:complete